jgi:hypothetical protein
MPGNTNREKSRKLTICSVAFIKLWPEEMAHTHNPSYLSEDWKIGRIAV